MAINVGDRVLVHASDGETATGVVTCIHSAEESAIVNELFKLFIGEDDSIPASFWSANIDVIYDELWDGFPSGTYSEEELEVLV